MFESARWISSPKDLWDVNEAAIMLRKEIYVTENIKSATMNIVGLGYGIYAVNDKEVTSDVLTTPYTKFDKTVLYNVYDVTELLKKGENCISIMLGNGFYNQHHKDEWGFYASTWKDRPKAIMQLDVEYVSGIKTSFVTDSSWMSSMNGPVVYNQVRCGEIYDARKEQTGWRKTGFDASGWGAAKICRGAGGEFKENIYTNIAVCDTFECINKNDKNVYDFGINISGWVEITVKGEAGACVKLHYGERIKDNGEIDAEHINKYNLGGKVRHEDVYILKGEGEEVYHPVFNYHGFKYVYVEIEGNAELLDIKAKFVHTNFDIIGEFECSDEMLNKIHKATRVATLSNFLSIPTDCPHREQNGWTGDASVSAQQSLMNYDMTLAYRKWLSDIRDAQRPSGQIPAIVPSPNFWGYTDYSGPSWDSAFVNIAYQTYEYTGNKTILKENIEALKLHVEYINSLTDNYIVSTGLTDWCVPEGAEICPREITDTAFYYDEVLKVGKICQVLGEDGEYYFKLAEKIKNAFRERFVNDDCIGDGGQASYATAIYNGLLNEDEVKSAAKRLSELVIEKDYHIDCGILGAKFLFSALSENGYDDVLYKMVTNPTRPSYAYWINCGMTALCEDWEMRASLNHHMYSEVDHWLYKYLGGINLSPDGLVIKPHFIGLKSLKVSHRDITVEYNENSIKIKSPVSFTLKLMGKTEKLEKGEYELSL